MLVLRLPLAKIFHALPGTDEGGAFTFDDALTRIRQVPKRSAADTAGWRLDHWQALCDDTVGGTDGAFQRARPPYHHTHKKTTTALH